MGMKMITTRAQIHDYFDRKIDEFEAECISHFEYAGEAAVADARTYGSYTDRTGNLRSSVGYVVVKDGEIVRKGGFGAVKGGEVGANEGEAYAESLASRYPKGIVLIVVAGMNYAAYVSFNGYNVLDSAELKAENIIKKLFGNG